MDKIVAYYRLSKMDERSTGLGIEAQQHIVRHYFRDQIVMEFTEVASGKNVKDRPILREAIEYCAANGCTLAVAKLDRLSRNVDDCRAILSQLGKNLRSCDIPGEIDKFTLTLFAAFAERERELISLRTSQALQAKIARGEKVGNPEYFTNAGRKKGADAMRFKAWSAEANHKATELIVDLRGRGWTYQRIADRLNHRKDLTFAGKRFTDCAVLRLHRRAVQHLTTC